MLTFLTQEDIETLTGYKRTADQRSHLQSLGIPFYPDRLGRPQVIREVLINPTTNGTSVVSANTMPDLEALKELENGT